MDTETSKTIEILRSSLVDCVNYLKVQEERLNLLSHAVNSLLEAKHNEAHASMSALDLKALGALGNASLDALIEKLQARPKAN